MPENTDKNLPVQVRAYRLSYREKWKARSTKDIRQHWLGTSSSPRSPSPRTPPLSLGWGCHRRGWCHRSPWKSPALSLKGARLILVGIVTHFFGNCIGKGADSIAHHHPMTALSKRRSRCPARPGAGSGLAGLDTFPFYNPLWVTRVSPGRGKVLTSGWRAALSRPSTWKQSAGRLGWGWTNPFVSPGQRLGRREGRLGLVSPC